MAKAICSSINFAVNGDAIDLNWLVLWYGADLPAPDVDICMVSLPNGTSKAAAKTLIRSAIQASADNLSIAWTGNVITPEELFAGL